MSKLTREELQTKIEAALLETERPGIEQLVQHMKGNWFYATPASTCHHSAWPGGLAFHSWLTHQIAHRTGRAILSAEDYSRLKNSITIASITHDIGKCGFHSQQLYMPAILKSGSVSKRKPYIRNSELDRIDHAIISLLIVEKYVSLSISEEAAIIYHAGQSGILSRDFHKNASDPLVQIVHFADLWAGQVLEKRFDNNNK